MSQRANSVTYEDFAALGRALQCHTGRACACSRIRGDMCMVHCPAHADAEPSLSLRYDGHKILFHCHADCSQEAVLAALRQRGLWPEARTPQPRAPKVLPLSSENAAKISANSDDKTTTERESTDTPGNRATALPLPAESLTLQQLAAAKHLPEAFLGELGVRDCSYRGQPAVRIPYIDADENEIAVRFRLALTAGRRFLWRNKDKVALYRWRFDLAQQAGWVIIVEGESDCWTLWHHGLPAVGIPGKSTWQSAWAAQLAGLEVYLWQEPDATKLPAQIAADLPGLKVIRAPEAYKDVSAAHLALGDDFPAWFAALRAAAAPLAELVDAATAQVRAELAGLAAPVLAHADPLALVADAVRATGYGGDLRAPLIVYLAVTSRLLAQRPGAMPVHLILIGPPSSGKSYAVNTALALFPEEAQHVIAAGTPRVLIYDDADLRHRALIFGEADSLPDSEDGSAASAIRNLLQDGFLHYDAAQRDPHSGDFIVRHIIKEGPTVLITTAVRWLGEQLMTRFFALEVDDTPAQVQASLLTQARLELEGAPPADAGLIAFQALLQAAAPWDVIVPFADRLAHALIGEDAAPRLNRDFARLLGLIKAVTVLRHAQRARDAAGRLIATLADYATVRGLVWEMYLASASDGSSDQVAAAVQVVAELYAEGRQIPVSGAEVARRLNIAKSSALRRLRAAVKQGWLIDQETQRGRPMRLSPGDPLPAPQGLPTADELRAAGDEP